MTGSLQYCSVARSSLTLFNAIKIPYDPSRKKAVVLMVVFSSVLTMMGRRYHFCSSLAYYPLTKSYRPSPPSCRNYRTGRSMLLMTKFSRTSSTIAADGGDPSTQSDSVLREVETTVSNVLGATTATDHQDIEDLPVEQREAVSIAKHLRRRLTSLRKNNDCPTCWMQRRHCICSQCPPVVGGHQKNIDSTNMLREIFFGGTTNVFKFGSYGDEKNDGNVHDHEEPSLELNRIFVVMHHKEIGLKVDTAKLILSSFGPHKSRLVVGGIGPEFQPSMDEMMMSLNNPTIDSFILFPDDTARTLEDVVASFESTLGRTSDLDRTNLEQKRTLTVESKSDQQATTRKIDLIVLDGTWAQARKFHTRYFGSKSLLSSTNQQQLSPENENVESVMEELSAPTSVGTNVYNIQLSDKAVDQLTSSGTNSGHQLRRHDITWRQVGTFEATLLFLEDWERLYFRKKNDCKNANNAAAIQKDFELERRTTRIRDAIGPYQEIANEAARREMGPPRLRQ